MFHGCSPVIDICALELETSAIVSQEYRLQFRCSVVVTPPLLFRIACRTFFVTDAEATTVCIPLRGLLSQLASDLSTE
jgi:hypothetical protein